MCNVFFTVNNRFVLGSINILVESQVQETTQQYNNTLLTLQKINMNTEEEAVILEVFRWF